MTFYKRENLILLLDVNKKEELKVIAMVSLVINIPYVLSNWEDWITYTSVLHSTESFPKKHIQYAALITRITIVLTYRV